MRVEKAIELERMFVTCINEALIYSNFIKFNKAHKVLRTGFWVTFCGTLLCQNALQRSGLLYGWHKSCNHCGSLRVCTMSQNILVILTLIYSFVVPMSLWAQAPQEVVVEGAKKEIQQESAVTLVVLSFLEWKALRVHEAQQKLEKLAQTSEASAQTGATGLGDKSIDSQKLNFNVEVALQLNIQDYFSMYLKTLTAEEFKAATQKLTAAEVHELLLAYKASLEAVKAPALRFSKADKK